MKDPNVLIKHILDAITRIQEYTRDIHQTDFEKNFLIQDAVLRNITIIGEATRNISDEFKNKFQDVEWRKITGMRNKVVHEYFIVDNETVWNVIQRDLPQLKQIFSQLLNQ